MTRALGESLQPVLPDLDGRGQGDDGAAGGRAQRPAVVESAQLAGETLDVVGQRVRRVELGDPLDQGVAPDLDPPGGADSDSLGGGAQQTRMVGDVGPRTDRAEVGEDIPNRLRLGRYGAAAASLGHLHTIRSGSHLVARIPFPGAVVGDQLLLRRPLLPPARAAG